MNQTQSYIPALSIDRLTRFYDPVLASVFQERRFRMPVVAAMRVEPGQSVLDIGCGTATLSLLIRRHTAAALVAGMDIDPVMLVAAQRKAVQSKAALHLARASADTLPYADGSFAHVVSSLMLHHLATAQKQRMLSEAWRVLQPGGAILVLDFGPVSAGALAKAAAALFGRFERIDDNLHGRVPALLAQAGFVEIRVDDVAFGGVIKLYGGRKTPGQ